jgi:hypothetical protein
MRNRTIIKRRKSQIKKTTRRIKLRKTMRGYRGGMFMSAQTPATRKKLTAQPLTGEALTGTTDSVNIGEEARADGSIRPVPRLVAEAAARRASRAAQQASEAPAAVITSATGSGSRPPPVRGARRASGPAARPAEAEAAEQAAEQAAAEAAEQAAAEAAQKKEAATANITAVLSNPESIEINDIQKLFVDFGTVQNKDEVLLMLKLICTLQGKIDTKQIYSIQGNVKELGDAEMKNAITKALNDLDTASEPQPNNQQINDILKTVVKACLTEENSYKIDPVPAS